RQHLQYVLQAVTEKKIDAVQAFNYFRSPKYYEAFVQQYFHIESQQWSEEVNHFFLLIEELVQQDVVLHDPISLESVSIGENEHEIISTFKKATATFLQEISELLENTPEQNMLLMKQVKIQEKKIEKKERQVKEFHNKLNSETKRYDKLLQELKQRERKNNELAQLLHAKSKEIAQFVTNQHEQELKMNVLITDIEKRNIWQEKCKGLELQIEAMQQQLNEYERHFTFLLQEQAIYRDQIAKLKKKV
ncbi:MAG: hypothetical protein ACRCWQ_07275, partial [Bacilli bacterium]